MASLSLTTPDWRSVRASAGGVRMYRAILMINAFIILQLSAQAQDVEGVWSDVKNYSELHGEPDCWSDSNMVDIVCFHGDGRYAYFQMTFCNTETEVNGEIVPNLFHYHAADTFFVSVGRWKPDGNGNILLSPHSMYVELEATSGNSSRQLVFGADKGKAYAINKVLADQFLGRIGVRQFKCSNRSDSLISDSGIVFRREQYLSPFSLNFTNQFIQNVEDQSLPQIDNVD